MTWAWKSSMSCKASFKLHGWKEVWALGLCGWWRRAALWAKVFSSVCRRKKGKMLRGMLLAHLLGLA